MGGFGKKGYFFDMWNKLDCFIVCTGLVEYIVVHAMHGIPGIQAVLIRILRIMKRILRPLRAVNRVTSMRVVAGLVIKTVPMLANVLLLCFLIFFIFGLIAVQLWAGLWRNRCTSIDPWILNLTSMMGVAPIYEDAAGDGLFICSLASGDGMNTCHESVLWNSTWENGSICAMSFNDEFEWDERGLPIESPNYCIDWHQYYNTCVTLDENPFGGALNFDNIFYAWITIFVVISQAGWTNIMYLTQNASSFWTWIYFFMLVIIGAIFALNLFLVVITTHFSSEEARRLTKLEKERERALKAEDDSDDDSVASYEDVQEIQNNAYASLIHNVTVQCRKAYIFFLKYYDKEAHKKLQEEKAQRRICHKMLLKGTLDPKNKARIENTLKLKKGFSINYLTVVEEEQAEVQAMEKGGFAKFQFKVWHIVIDPRFSRLVLLGICLNTVFMALEAHNQPVWISTLFESFNYFFTALFAVEMVLKIIGLGPYGYIKDPLNLFDGTIVITRYVIMTLPTERFYSIKAKTEHRPI